MRLLERNVDKSQFKMRGRGRLRNSLWMGGDRTGDESSCDVWARKEPEVMVRLNEPDDEL